MGRHKFRQGLVHIARGVTVVARRHRRLGLVLAVALYTAPWPVSGLAASPAAPPAACSFSPTSPVFVSLATTFGGVVIDDACQYVYLTNTTLNRVEVYSLQTQTLEAPIQVGAQPIGLDLTPDGSLLYVANSGGSNISVVDLAQREELRKITVPPPSFLADTPYSIAIGNSGRAIFSTRTTGSSGGRVMDLVLATDAIAHRVDFGFLGTATDRTRLRASADRGTIAIVEGGTSGGPVSTYDAAANSFSAETRLQSDITDIAIGAGASAMLVARLQPLFTVLDSSLRMIGNVSVATASRGVAVDPVWNLGYRSVNAVVEILNLSTFLKVGQLAIGDSVSLATPFNSVGRMDISRDGALLAVITNNGFSIVKTDSSGPVQNFDFIRHGRFDNGSGMWQTVATPEPGNLHSQVTAGVFEFNRIGGDGQAAVFQESGLALPAAATLEARFSLGNSSTVPKSITVVVGNADFTSAESCTFVVPAGAALSGYRMRLLTGQAWTNAAIYFHADTAGSDGGFNRLDNVSLRYDTALAVTTTICTPPASPPPSSGCGITPPGNFVPLSGTIGGALIDDACRYVYITNSTQNRVEVYSLETMSFEDAIPVGAQPRSLDLSANGSVLYVGNTGGTNVSVVDLGQRAETHKIHLQTPDHDTPLSLALASNGKMIIAAASLTTTGGSLMELDTLTEQTLERTDFGTANNRIYVKASGNRGTLVLANGNSSGGPVRTYSAISNTFGPVRSLGATLSDVAINRTGTSLLASPGTFVLDSALNVTGTVVGGSGFGGVVLDPTWPVGYRAVGSNLEVLNLSTYLEGANLPLGNAVTNASLFNSVGRMAISRDGLLVAVITNTGFSLVAPPAAAPQLTNLVQNGGFSVGLSGWQTYATPDPSFIDANVTGGVLQFNRLPVAGGSNQAVVFQHTGLALPAGAPVQARFDLGNSSAVRKRISVLLLDADFSDLHVCTFWIPPGSPLATYRMRSHSTKSWANTAIYFYAATEGADDGFNLIDNVSLTYDASLPGDRTDCEDPLAPVPPGGLDSADLIVNGDFGAGAIAPWIVFGTLTSQVSGGVFEFVRPTSALPAGVVLQPTGQPVGANGLLTATFDLGNSSAVRKRVTVLLHDANFNDLSACTFWLAPGQAPATYTMRTFATIAWSNATASFYAATVDTQSWTALDNVSLRLTPGTPVVGTECGEPAAIGAANVQSSGIPVAATVSGEPSRRLPATDRPRLPGAVLRPARAGTSPEFGEVVGLTDWIDLTDASGARLALQSWLLFPDGAGEIQIITDTLERSAVLRLESSDDWAAIEVDLGPWLGRRIAVRFVGFDAPRNPGVWRIRGVRVEIERRH